MTKLLELSENCIRPYRYVTAISFWGLGAIADQQGDMHRALDYLNNSYDILLEINSDDRFEVQAYIEQLKRNLLQSFALFLQVLDSSQNKQKRKQRKNHRSSTKYLFESWKIRQLFEMWKEHNFYLTEEGCEQSAKELMEKLLELFDNEQYPYRYGKAIALWGLGAIYSQEGNINTGLGYLNQSYQILLEIGSDDAVELQTYLQKIQENE